MRGGVRAVDEWYASGTALKAAKSSLRKDPEGQVLSMGDPAPVEVSVNRGRQSEQPKT